MGLLDFFKSIKKEKKEIDMSSQDSNKCTKQENLSEQGATNETKNLDSIALLSRLKEIAKDPTEYQIYRGAMCYSPAHFDEEEEEEEEEYKSCICSLCSREIGRFEVLDYRILIELSGQIKKTGLAEVKIVCIDCLMEMCMSGNYTYNITEWDIYEHIKHDYKECNETGSTNIDSEELLKWVWEKQKNLRKRNRRNPLSGKYEEPYYLVFLFKAADYDKPRLTVIYRHTLNHFLAFIQNRQAWESWNDSIILLRNNIHTVEKLTGLKL